VTAPVEVVVVVAPLGDPPLVGVVDTVVVIAYWIFLPGSGLQIVAV